MYNIDQKKLKKYFLQHINRIIDHTDNFYLEEDSICRKCHDTGNDINCLFCFCPFYELEDCGGDYIVLESGIKDCSGCMLRHDREFIVAFFEAIYENATTIKKWMQDKEKE